jgi:very-short-patch-repair endonuclease
LFRYTIGATLSWCLATPAQIARDRRNELTLRTAGILVLRYASDQLRDQIELVVDDVRAAYNRPDIQPR